jgi:anti-sigma-K factor RskA
MTEHEQWDELAAGYALHALAPDEETRFVDHLATCDECKDSVKDHELVAAQLGSISHHRETDDAPPSWESMRQSIVGDHPADLDERNVVDLAAQRRRYEISRRTLAAAAAVVVVAGGGVVTWQLARGGGSTCSASAGCHAIQLDAAQGRSLASLVVRHTSVTLTPTNMPAAPAGKVYVLWQVPSDAPATPISEFRSGTGGAAATGHLDVAYADTQQFAVSLESATTSPPQRPSNTLASGLAS